MLGGSGVNLTSKLFYLFIYLFSLLQIGYKAFRNKRLEKIENSQICLSATPKIHQTANKKLCKTTFCKPKKCLTLCLPTNRDPLGLSQYQKVAVIKRARNPPSARFSVKIHRCWSFLTNVPRPATSLSK